MKTYTLTEEELDQLLKERLEKRRLRVDANNVFLGVAIDDDEEITPINEKYPSVVEKLDISRAIRPRRFIFSENPKVNDVTGDVDYHRIGETDIHASLRQLTLKIFGKTKNTELTESEFSQAQEYYTNFKNLFLESYDKRLKTLVEG